MDMFVFLNFENSTTEAETRSNIHARRPEVSHVSTCRRFISAHECKLVFKSQIEYTLFNAGVFP